MADSESCRWHEAISRRILNQRKLTTMSVFVKSYRTLTTPGHVHSNMFYFEKQSLLEPLLVGKLWWHPRSLPFWLLSVMTQPPAVNLNTFSNSSTFVIGPWEEIFALSFHHCCSLIVFVFCNWSTICRVGHLLAVTQKHRSVDVPTELSKGLVLLCLVQFFAECRHWLTESTLTKQPGFAFMKFLPELTLISSGRPPATCVTCYGQSYWEFCYPRVFYISFFKLGRKKRFIKKCLSSQHSISKCYTKIDGSLTVFCLCSLRQTNSIWVFF